jgi:hypothetical protein
MNITKSDRCMMKQIHKENSISSNDEVNSQTIGDKVTNIHHKNIDNDNTSQKPCINDRVKLVYIDDEYSGLTKNIGGTITGLSSIREVFGHDNRPESIIWVEWDNGIKLGLIEGIDKYEIISNTQREQQHFRDTKESMVVNK